MPAHFFFNDTATTEIYTLSLHGRSSDLVASAAQTTVRMVEIERTLSEARPGVHAVANTTGHGLDREFADRKSTRLNSSHPSISYAVFCLKKKKNKIKLVAVPLQLIINCT